MFEIYRALSNRVKAVFAADAALEFEAEFLTRAAERKAELLRQAERYEREGLRGIALHLRRQAEELSEQRPLASVLPAIDHLAGRDSAALPDTTSAVASASPERLPLAAPTKRGRKL
jgi:hypothetical protein